VIDCLSVQERDRTKTIAKPASAARASAPGAGTLLVGEDPRTAGFDEAVHWIQVYGQLVRLQTVLLERMDQLLPAVTNDAKKEAHVFRAFSRERYARFRRSLEDWVLRAGDLTDALRREAQRTW
jgi:hypothetical protein